MKPNLILIAIFLAVNICFAAGESKVWVNKSFKGPAQCAPAGGYKFLSAVEPVADNLADLIAQQEQKFAQEKIEILGKEINEIPVCAACDVCPEYEAEIRFLIKKQDLPKVEAIGYNNADPEKHVMSVGYPQDVWQDAGYLSNGHVYATNNLDEAVPWAKVPDRGVFLGQIEELGIKESWQELSAENLVIFNSGKPVKLVIARSGDFRWTMLGIAQVKSGQDKIELLINMQRRKGPHIENYMPSLWSTSVIIDSLKPGEYSVFLGQSLVGKIRLE
ncbi:MAG: hypothetical protein MUF05_00040 [Candidatus Omnitrophica bacterium]|jgi:hypothetical protein|nr:hypothetical protein [Candidatus Omnitrophota bacterium]